MSQSGHTKRLLSSTLIYGFGGILSRTIGLLLFPLLTRYLTPADYGLNSILGVVALFVTPVFSLGLSAAIGALYFSGPDRERQRGAIIWTAFILLVGSSAVLGALAFGAPTVISRLAFGQASFEHLITLSLITACLQIVATPLFLYLQFQQRAKTFVLINGWSAIVGAVLSVFLVVVSRRHVLGMVEATLMQQVVTLPPLLWLVYRDLPIRVSWEVGRKLLHNGIPLVPSFLFLFLLQQSNKYILQWSAGLDEVGLYAIGLGFGMLLSLVSGAFATAWLPFAMTFVDDREEAARVFRRVMSYYVLVGGTLSLLFFVVAKPVVMVFTQPAFYRAAEVIGLSACAQFLTGAYGILLPAVYFEQEVRYIGFVQAVAAFITVIVNLVLIHVFGLLGAGLGLAAGGVALLGCQYLWNRRRRATYLWVDYEWSRIFRFLAGYVAFAAAMLWDRHLGLWAEMTVSAITIVAIMAFAFAALLPEERLMIRSAYVSTLRRLRRSGHSAKS